MESQKQRGLLEWFEDDADCDCWRRGNICNCVTKTAGEKANEFMSDHPDLEPVGLTSHRDRLYVCFKVV